MSIVWMIKIIFYRHWCFGVNQRLLLVLKHGGNDCLIFVYYFHTC